MLALLSRDETVRRTFREQYRDSPDIPQKENLPYIIWSRRYLDLPPFWVWRDADHTRVVNFFCLYGPPDTGKTAFAHHLADRLGRQLHHRQGSDLLSCWVGQTEKNIALRAQRA